jgi:hypothetical protein
VKYFQVAPVYPHLAVFTPRTYFVLSTARDVKKGLPSLREHAQTDHLPMDLL